MQGEPNDTVHNAGETTYNNKFKFCGVKGQENLTLKLWIFMIIIGYAYVKAW